MRHLASAAILVALALPASAQAPPPSPEPIPASVRVKEGQDARIDCVTPSGQFGSAPIFRLMEEGMAYSVEYRDRADARKAADPENLVMLGHNTPVKVLRLYAWRDHLGRLHAIARVKVGGGTLRDEEFWTAAGLMRTEGTPGKR